MIRAQMMTNAAITPPTMAPISMSTMIKIIVFNFIKNIIIILFLRGGNVGG